LECFEIEGEDFLSRIVISDETWVQHLKLEIKRDRTRVGTDRAHMHLFLGARLWK
jgi:hypothetical protein